MGFQFQERKEKSTILKKRFPTLSKWKRFTSKSPEDLSFACAAFRRTLYMAGSTRQA